MEEKRTGLFENGLIWFGAGVSIAEILTGTYLAPLGKGKGLAAIIVGHIIFYRIARKESFELAVQLCCQRLVVCQHQRRAIDLLDDVCHGEGFT